MLKYFSLVVILGALIWTWNLTNAEPDVSINVHASLQQEVEDIIRNYIQQHRPSAQNIQFYQLFTETINPNKVKAVFKYSFDDTITGNDATHQMFEGQVILNRDIKAEGDKSVWNLDEVNASNTAIEYKKGANIRPGPNGIEEQEGSSDQDGSKAPEEDPD